MAFLVLSFNFTFAQWSGGIIKEGDELVILEIYDSKGRNFISVDDNGRRVKKVKGETVIASQKILWENIDGAVRFRNERTSAPVTYCSKEAERIKGPRSLWDYVCSLFNSKTRGVKGDDDKVDTMKSLLSATWYMYFGEVCIPSVLPQSNREHRYYLAEPLALDGGRQIPLAYDDKTNEIIITKENFQSMGLVNLKHGDSVVLRIDYSDGKIVCCLSSSLKVVYEN